MNNNNIEIWKQEGIQDFIDWVGDNKSLNTKIMLSNYFNEYLNEV